VHAQAVVVFGPAKKHVKPAAPQQPPKGLAEAVSAAAFLPHKLTPAHRDALAAFQQYQKFYLEEVTPPPCCPHPAVGHLRTSVNAFKHAQSMLACIL
jgi:hypothetical protein